MTISEEDLTEATLKFLDTDNSTDMWMVEDMWEEYNLERGYILGYLSFFAD